MFVVSLIVSITPLSWFDSQAVDGSFGIRPKTHKCIGFTVPATVNKYLLRGNISFPLILGKKFVYNVQKEETRDYCIGQDIWLGE